MSRLAVLLACLLPAAVFAQVELPPGSQGLLDQARIARPERFQFAVDHGAQFLPTSDGQSFYLLWLPPGATPGALPLLATLHGSQSWAVDEFFLWYETANAAGCGMVALQWWMGDSDLNESYYAPEALHRELAAALRHAGAVEGNTMLHGFSRGSANLYGVVALDVSSRDRFYGMILANAGGASPDFPPNRAISDGAHGYAAFGGTHWIMFCGGNDPNPMRDGCPAMHGTEEWVGRYGGVVDLFMEDAAAKHGGFHQSPEHLRAALDAFRRNQESRRGAPSANTVWSVRRDPSFQIQGASIPNAGWVGGEVWLVVGGRGGPKLFRSLDGANAQTSESIAGLGEAFAKLDFKPGEVVPRQLADGRRSLVVLGNGPPQSGRASVFRMVENEGGKFVLDPAEPVFPAEPFAGVPDVSIAANGDCLLLYVSLSSTPHNSRVALSTDSGASFQPSFGNPFGDAAVPKPNASTTNVDPAFLGLASGGYLAVTMRAGKLYFFTSIDGRTFAASPDPALEAEQLLPGASMLFDPTLVQLADGRIFLYATAGMDPAGQNSSVVRAELTR